MLETFPHPNLDGEAHQQDTGGTVPVDSEIFMKLTGNIHMIGITL